MGDGRYYTYYQFMDITIVMILCVLSIVSMLFFYYRKNKDMDINYIFLPQGLNLSFLILRTIESVSPNLGLASLLRQFGLFLLITAVYLSIGEKDYIEKWKRVIVVMTLIAAMVNSLLNNFIQNYAFHNMDYSVLYKLVILSLLMSLLIYFFKNKKRDTYQKHLIILVPMTLYMTMIFYKSHTVCYIELIISLSVIVYTNLIFRLNSKSSHTILAFDKIGDISTNYIFVIDRDNRLIYNNKMAKQSEFFGDVTRIETVDKIFNCDASKFYSHFEKEYINIKKDNQDYYFTYEFSALYDMGREIGRVLTITNITELISLLNDLEEKKSESEKLNEELKNYTKVVYHLEKEKKINNLLEEIVLTRDSQMNYLIQLINDTKEVIDDTSFENSIEQSIEQSNAILNDVRDTVTKYREY